MINLFTLLLKNSLGSLQKFLGCLSNSTRGFLVFALADGNRSMLFVRMINKLNIEDVINNETPQTAVLNDISLSGFDT